MNDFLMQHTGGGLFDSFEPPAPTGDGATATDAEHDGRSAGIDVDALQVTLQVDAGRAELSVAALRALRAGAIVELDASAPAQVRIALNGRPFASGVLVDVEGRAAVQLLSIDGTE